MIPRLSLHDIHKTFGATRALDGVDLHVRPGEVHAIIGENGAGKSTLMRVLSGAHQPDRGEIRIDGSLTRFAGPRDSQSAGIAMIYQELNLAPDLTVCQNIMLGREPVRARSAFGQLARGIGWVDRDSERRLATDALAKLNCSHLPLDRPASKLSLAEQQMVEIARAIVTSSVSSSDDISDSLKLLILDEPTSSLTQVDTQRLFDVINRLSQSGVSVLYISHFLEECERIADRFTVLRDGRTVATGRMPTTDSSPADSDSPHEQTESKNEKDIDENPPVPMGDIIRYMVGREMSDLYPHFTHTRGDVALEVNQLQSADGPQSVSFELHYGEILGFAGLIGAGRTETLRTIFGLDTLTGGSVRIARRDNNDRSTGPRRPDLSWSHDSMGIVSEDRKNEGLFLQRSLTDNLTATRLDAYRRTGLLSSSAMSRATEQWMKNLDVKAASPNQPIGELSGGNQQKIALARLLHHNCDILLLDEPTRGIDIGSKSVIYRQIGELAAAGKAIILVSSYLPELLGVCDRIGVFATGRLTEIRETAQWTEHDLLAAAINESDALGG
ncbi:sugar ABC transporter ATP-binding protein [Rhodopirellula sallentina]|uniref:Ribose import ATP-binding protein rbsA n=1 Tax=Rhodopirellula sallentina SM41 TaxID=1263870 RepID=M5TV97_9BACT|nr:sugar ABC transporter ATP-binding protein [Rhodopirellula sallentina]EMI53095.1 Ribose import ATP-binding protein rbsA [Rhodopirellula sallentina SM41]